MNGISEIEVAGQPLMIDESAEAIDNASNTGVIQAEDTRSGDAKTPREIGGREGPEPTRYGDWEKCGRCIDF
jgi:hypothetical protein